MLQQLSVGATNAETASKRCQQTLRDVQKLLDPDSLTQFKFKTPKRSHAFNGSTKNSKLGSPALSPFAKMVFESTNVSYRYLTPESPEREVRPNANGTTSRSRVKLETTQIQPNGYITPQQEEPTPSSQQRKVQAVVPSMLTPAQRAEYQYVPVKHSTAGAQYITSSNRTKIGASAMSVDQRHKGDVAVQNLQNVLQEIFEAEDQLEPDTSGVVAPRSSTIFATRDTNEGSIPVLQPDVQIRLESCVAKAASNGRLLDIETENLARAQKLCEGPVAAVESLALSIAEDWGEQDIEEWVVKVGAAESGLIAARTLMRVMSGGAQEKELQSEDFLRETLEALKTAIEGCLVPIVEEPAFARERIRGEKDGPPQNPKFAVASSNRNVLLSLLHAATRDLKQLGELLVKTDFDETSISSVEYLCKTLIFAENASTERESALGIQNFETMRRCAMDVLAKIFTKYTEQRQFIFDEILISLEKLPAQKQSARQYRLVDSKPIQLVSALLMRLVQTSATKSNEALRTRSKAEVDESEDGASEDASEDDERSDDEDNIKVSPSKPKGVDLVSVTKPLHDAAQSNASYIVTILIQRAVSTSKSSDEPYRKLLDIFTEDFLNVLGHSDWPAAELLLRTLVLRMIGIIENPKSPVPSRTLALELLGTMGSGILELQSLTRDTARSIDVSDSVFAERLREMTRQLETGYVDTRDMVAFDGPYRIVVQYLEDKLTGDDAQLQTARGYHLMQWAFSVVGGREGSTDSDASDAPRSSKDLQSHLRNVFANSQWVVQHSAVERLSTATGRLAAMVITLNSNFCRAFNKMFSILMSSMSSELPTVKSRSLKSVVTLLEKDPSILDRNVHVMTHIFRCANDASPLVRDSAIGLIDKCIMLRPGLDGMVYKRVIDRTQDAAIGVRKRAMKLLKTIYLRNNSDFLRSAIVNAIISRIEDTEDSVVEIARATIEEIWFQPFYNLKIDGERSVEARLAYGAQAALLINTVESADNVLKVLESLIRRMLTTSKAAELNAQVCRTLVAVLFDGIIDNNDLPGAPTQDAILRSLTIFARASPQLFTAPQLERLEPYTQNLSNTDDLDVYRSVITILRHVVPHQPLMKSESLQKMQTILLTSIAKLAKTELDEVAPCLWTISCIIDNTKRLATTIASVLTQITKLHKTDLAADEQITLRIRKLITIAGAFGNACDFESHVSVFKASCDSFKGNSVPAHIVETLCPLTSPKRPLKIRLVAMEAVCAVCQAWPKQYLRADVTNAFETVFTERISSLEVVLLAGLEGFFIAQEVNDEAEGVAELGDSAETGTERLGRTYVASDQDGASTSMAQRFLSSFLRLALSSCDEPAFRAARLVISINKQGLVHPKESGPALVALETCPDKSIASEAFKEHKSQHQKHESLFEKEYMRAVQQAFQYQYRVIGDAKGCLRDPPTSKLHLTWDVLKSGKAQVRKKFMSNIAQKLDFDPSKLQVTTNTPQHLLFVKFCVENLAFFEYDKVDELLHLLSSLEKTFAGTGTSVAQAIESEVLNLQVDGFGGAAGKVNGTVEINGTSDIVVAQPTHADVDLTRLRQLAVSAQILTLIWETRSFLRRLWNMQKHMVKQKQAAKDVNRAPNRATNAPPLTEAYLRRITEILSVAESEEQQRAVCNAFVELISIDNEVKVGSDEDAAGELVDGYDTPSEGGSGKSPSLPPSGGGRGRKRKSLSVSNTPRKKGRARKSASARLSEDDEEDGGWD